MKTLIIGGGLSGLALAERLTNLGQDFHLVEARDRFGGRMETQHWGSAYFDLGPAWFWPGQPRVAELVDRFGLRRFDQYSTGDLIYENEFGHVQRGRGFASMEGSWRIEGGFAALTTALEMCVPASRKRCNAKTTALELHNGICTATLADGSAIEGDRIVLAMPPRIAETIDFSPALPEESAAALASVPTWMAGQAKIVAVFNSPFWRDRGLSGDAMSRMGPMAEIHDASPASGGPYALFGFVGVPPQARLDQHALRQAAVAQLTRLFGTDAAEPEAVYIKDWAQDPLTATPLDSRPQHSHPAYGMPEALRGLWEDRVIFAGTEVASNFGGYIEGALEAADAALTVLSGDMQNRLAAHDQV
jgi:monoamine oxidase